MCWPLNFLVAMNPVRLIRSRGHVPKVRIRCLECQSPKAGDRAVGSMEEFPAQAVRLVLDDEKTVGVARVFIAR